MVKIRIIQVTGDWLEIVTTDTEIAEFTKSLGKKFIFKMITNILLTIVVFTKQQKL